MVSIVPFLHLGDPVLIAVITEEFLHFILRESEHLVILRGEYVDDLGVVQPGEYALLGDLHDSGDDSESHRPVVLQRAAEHIAHQCDDTRMQFLVAVGVVHGVVVLVYEDDRLLPVVGFDHLAEVPDRIGEGVVIGGALSQSRVPSAEVLGELLRSLQFRELGEDVDDRVLERFLEDLVGLGPEILEIQVDDVVGVLLGVVRTDFGNLQTFEAVVILGILDVEIAVRHAEVQCLSEPAGAGEQCDISAGFQDLVDDHRFVHIIEVPVSQNLEVALSNRHPFQDRSLRLLIRSLEFQAVPHTRVHPAEDRAFLAMLVAHSGKHTRSSLKEDQCMQYYRMVFIS